MAGYSVSRKGRTYWRGQSLDEDLRTNIIDVIISEGGDLASGLFPGQYKDIADRYRVSASFVAKQWKQVCNTGEHKPPKNKSGNPPHLKPEDVELVEFLKVEKPSKTYKSIKEDIDHYCMLQGGTSLAAIGTVVRNKLSDGKFTRKRLTKPSSEKFTFTNLNYCQHFLDVISSLPPEKLKFFDEAGIHTGTGDPVYGHSLRGTPAIKISRNKKGANITPSLLCGFMRIL